MLLHSVNVIPSPVFWICFFFFLNSLFHGLLAWCIWIQNESVRILHPNFVNKMKIWKKEMNESLFHWTHWILIQNYGEKVYQMLFDFLIYHTNKVWHDFFINHASSRWNSSRKTVCLRLLSSFPFSWICNTNWML
jgi:hypothetical protein